MNGTNYLLIVSLLTQDAKVLFFLKVKWGAFWLCVFVFSLVFFDPLSTSCLTCPIWEIRFSLSFLWAAHSNESWCCGKWSASNDPSSLTQTADTALHSSPNLAHLQINSTFSFYMSGWLSLFYIYIYIYAFSRRFYPKRLTLHSSYSFYIFISSLSDLLRVLFVRLLSSFIVLYPTVIFSPSQPLFMNRDLLVWVGVLGGGGLHCSSGLLR